MIILQIEPKIILAESNDAENAKESFWQSRPEFAAPYNLHLSRCICLELKSILYKRDEKCCIYSAKRINMPFK